ncbi:unnamed protein product [Sphenostylis stenocarpa]|uniref:Uncharacterized protein n=1 Tax=Sphenostylis stenocarpa TaxID=92480 RepID=A0AA86VIR9_9FABA|nr:unnamed protein product [Sphenostylis stenocarpa]
MKMMGEMGWIYCPKDAVIRGLLFPWICDKNASQWSIKLIETGFWFGGTLKTSYTLHEDHEASEDKNGQILPVNPFKNGDGGRGKKRSSDIILTA